MQDSNIITDSMDMFYYSILNHYRQLEKKDKENMRVRNVFVPKDFLSTIFELKELKESLQSLRINRSLLTDEHAVAVKEQLDIVLDLFSELIDCRILMNKYLERKMNGEKSIKKGYRETVLRREAINKKFRLALISLDDIYSEYISQ